MNLRLQGARQDTAAACAGFCVRTAYRIEHQIHQPRSPMPRTYRTRPDPLATIWHAELLPLLQQNPTLRPITLWEYLQQKYPEQYPQSLLRTLQRRIQQWLALEGPPKPVIFRQTHPPGRMGLSDFTELKQATITIAGQPFPHLLYHFRLAHSGWSYVQVMQGGESFLALAQGLQNALWLIGGAPQEHRTDSLSAAYRNLHPDARTDLTATYRALCQHYGMVPSRNNRGQSHENGSVESPHGHFKRRLAQALLLRGSYDFVSIAAYQQLVDEVIASLNRLHQGPMELERAHLQPLPVERYSEYQVIWTTVSSTSTIDIRCILYTVPSRLIGQRLRIHLYQEHLDGFVGIHLAVTLRRVWSTDPHKRRARCVDYRHVIDSLYRKPRAFAHCQYREELLPNPHWRQLWPQMLEQFDLDVACKLMVSALYLAAKRDQEHALAQYLAEQLTLGQLSLSKLMGQFEPPPSAQLDNNFDQHPLTGYDQLLWEGGKYLA